MKKVVLFLLTTVCVYAQSNGDILNERYEEIRESYLTGNKYDCGAFFDAMRKAKAEGMSKYREFIYKYKEQEVFRVCFHLDRVDKYNAEHNQYNLSISNKKLDGITDTESFKLKIKEQMQVR